MARAHPRLTLERFSGDRKDVAIVAAREAGEAVTGEPVTVAHDYVCPKCVRVVLKQIDPRTHPWRFHRIALQCVCGELLQVPEALQLRDASPYDGPHIKNVGTSE